MFPLKYEKLQFSYIFLARITNNRQRCIVFLWGFASKGYPECILESAAHDDGDDDIKQRVICVM